MKKIIVALLLIGSLLSITSCEKFLEVPLPVDELATEKIFKSKKTIDGAVIGIYNAVATLVHAWDYTYLVYLSDELYYPVTAGTRQDLAIANIDPTNSQVTSWSHIYTMIYRANLVIENIPGVSNDILTEAEKDRYLGEAKYLRAYTYWFMVNYWGEVPLVLTTDLEENIKLPRASVDLVYDQIVSDLEDAAALLPATVSPASSRIHNKYQAEALLARVYLYQGLWSQAETAANNVITQSGYYQLLPVLTDVFKRDSKEALFSIRESANVSFYLDKSLYGAVMLSDVNHAIHPSIVSKFEPGDARVTSWTRTVSGRIQPFKYIHSLTANASTNPQDFILQRYSELYLIRAEAKAMQNKLTGTDGAIADINTIRTRALLSDTPAVTQAEVIDAIGDERIRELLGEGHRWFDLKRRGIADQVLGALPHKAANYQSYMKFMPIATREIDANPALLQTEGYN